MRTRLCLAALFLPACKPPPAPPGPQSSPLDQHVGEGIFAAGCSQEGAASVRRLGGGSDRMWGTDVLGKSGDLLLMNAVAAYVISDVTDMRTYYHYGGIPIDAVAVAGCAQAGPEQFGEMGVVVGTLELTDFPASTLRMFRGESITVVKDGSDGGPVVVDVDGVDDRFWLVELELVRQSFQAGVKKPLTDPYGFAMTLRYTLFPNDPVLRAEVILSHEGAGAGGYMAGALLFPSDHTPTRAFWSSTVGAGGLGLTVGVPWVGAPGRQGAVAFAIEGANAGVAEISGVTALLDTTLAFSPLTLAQAGDTASTTLLISVGPTDLSSATRPLAAANPNPTPTTRHGLLPVNGAVVDPSGAPLADVAIEVAAQTGGEWRAIDALRTDAAGQFEGALPDLGLGPLRLRPFTQGRGSGETVETTGGTLTLLLGPAGAVVTDLRDEAGEELPAEVVFFQEGVEVQRFFSTPADPVVAIPPGTYEVSVVRGYEYSPVDAVITVPEEGEALLEATLERVVDTLGWVAYDGHVHSSGSPDSTLLQADRIRTAAAAGLEIVVATDHEIINDLDPAVDEAQLSGFVSTITGQEVTATLPEHINAWPFEVDESASRGGNPAWYGLSIGEIYALIRARGAEVVTLNHPRGGCNYLCLIGWDRENGVPTLDDPTMLAFAPGSALWSWDFDAMEYMNGHTSPFLNPDDPDRTGLLNDWLGFLNLGHRVTAVGVTDVHGAEAPGSPRTYVESSTDEAGAIDEAEVVAAVKGGRALVSAGAFARVSVNGASIGETAILDGAPAVLSAEVVALPGIEVTELRVLVNCDEVARLPADDPDGLIKFEGELALDLTVDSAVVLLGMGEAPFPRGLPQFDGRLVPRVTTNAIYVDVDGNGVFDAPGPKGCDIPYPG